MTSRRIFSAEELDQYAASGDSDSTTSAALWQAAAQARVIQALRRHLDNDEYSRLEAWFDELLTEEGLR